MTDVALISHVTNRDNEPAEQQLIFGFQFEFIFLSFCSGLFLYGKII